MECGDQFQQSTTFQAPTQQKTDFEVLDQQTTDLEAPAQQTRGDDPASAFSWESTGTDKYPSSYRDKLRYTAFIMVTNVALGCMYTVTPAAFLDLLQRTETEIGKGSLLFTMLGSGYLTGSLISGPLYDKFNRDIIYGTSAAVGGLFTIFIPWPKLFPLVACLLFFNSMCQGSIDSGTPFICVTIWRKAANPYQQSLFFFFAIGGLLAPLLAEPFLLQSGIINNTLSSGVSDILRRTTNCSRFSESMVSASYPRNLNGCAILYYGEEQNSLLYVPFLVIGTFSLISSIPYFIMFYQNWNTAIKTVMSTAASDVCSLTTTTTTKSKEDQDIDHRGKLCSHSGTSRKMLIIILCLIWMYFFAHGSYMSLTEFAMPFLVDHLDWTKTEGVRLISGMWGAFAVGCFLCIFATKFVSPGKMVIMDMVLISVGLAVLIFGGRNSYEIVWIGFLLINAGLGSLYPSAVCWVDQNLIKVSGKICSLFTVSGSVAEIIYSILLGHFFDMSLPEWLIYLLIISACCEWISLLMMFVLSRQLSTKRSLSFEVNVPYKNNHHW